MVADKQKEEESISGLLLEALQPVCSECNEKLPNASSSGTPAYLLCCEKCKPIKHLKENWKPLGSGKVSRIFRI